MTQRVQHEQYMAEALRLAERGRGFTSPNPVVGAVLVKGDRVVGRGWHREFGGPHAEVEAIRDAGKKARGATLYVTLEPCSHFGKTPPCTAAVIEAGIARVVLGARDPNPMARGGAKVLRKAGVHVVEGILERECREKNAPFFKRIRTGLPFVTAKWAMTLDGKIATASGDSRWVTGEAAREAAQRLRAEHDAVMVGVGTVLADAPRLNCRYPGTAWQPKRIVLDSLARTPPNSPLLRSDGGQVIVAATDRAPRKRLAALAKAGAEILIVPSRPSGPGAERCAAGASPVPHSGKPGHPGNPRVDLRNLLRSLAGRGVLSVMIEGGAEALGSAFDAGLVDRAVVFLGPKVLGGRDALSAVGGRGARRMAAAAQGRFVRVELFWPDTMVEAEIGDWPWIRP